MATQRPSSVQPAPPGSYPDVLRAVMGNTTTALGFAIGCVLLAHALSIVNRPVVTLLAAELLTLLGAYAATHRHPHAVHIPVQWLLTLLCVIALALHRDTATSADWLFALGCAAIVAYWLVRAVRGSLHQYRDSTDDPLAIAVADLLTVWGAFLQIAFIANALLASLFDGLLQTSSVGRTLQSGLRLVHSSSILMWAPSGLVILGLTILAAMRFRTNPYTPIDYAEIAINPQVKDNAVDTILTPLRIPLWLLVIIAGFLIHFARQLIAALRTFLEDWGGRLLLTFFVCILPTLLFLLGHASGWGASLLTSRHLAVSHSFPYLLGGFIGIHILILVSLSAYVSASAIALMPISRLGFHDALKAIVRFVLEDGLAAIRSVGKAFALSGMFIVAIPAATTLPFGSSFGLYSTVYLGGVLLLYLLSRYREPLRHRLGHMIASLKARRSGAQARIPGRPWGDG